MGILQHIVIVFLVLVTVAKGDYTCVCSYNVEKEVFPDKSTNAQPMDYLYEFDCKPAYGDTTGQWLAITIQHKIGYVQRNTQTAVQVCQGSPHYVDTLPNTSAPPSTPVMSTSTTDAVTMSTMPIVSSSEATMRPSMQSTTTVPATTTSTMSTITSTMSTTTSSTSITTSTTPSTTLTTPQTTSTTTSTMPTTTQTTLTTTSTTPMTTSTTQTTPTTTPTTTSTTQTTPTTTPITTSTTQTTPTTTPTTTSTTQTTPTTTPTTTSTTQTTPTTTPTTTSTTQTTPTTTKATPTTTVTMATTTKHRQPKTTPAATTTAKPSTTSTEQSTVYPVEQCSDDIQLHAAENNGHAYMLLHNCYEIIPTEASWHEAELDCKSRGGHLADITTATEQAVLTRHLDFYLSDDVWIGLEDYSREEHFKWSSGVEFQYTNWVLGRKDHLAHRYEDCAVMITPTYEWDDVDCDERHGYVCKYGTNKTDSQNYSAVPMTIPTTLPPSGNPIDTDGNEQRCSQKVQYLVHHFHTALAQYGDSCYQLMINKVTWEEAEDLCIKGGGHLVHINDAEEQAYIVGFMKRHDITTAAWIGMHDLNDEGEFEWTDGDRSHYTHWMKGSYNNYASHRQEDCCVIKPNHSFTWDDLVCDSDHLPLCEYETDDDVPDGFLFG